ncbi:MAG: hypothetical protein IPL74_19450 [Bacteroidetes bacterium]|nr:hypothetical protein [Bacteroidota bacterium]
MSKINPPSKYGGNKILLPKPTIEIEDFKYPIFCLKHIHNKFSLSQCTTEQKCGLINKLHQMSQSTWLDLIGTGRHKAGSEKILISSIKSQVPNFITDEVNYLLAFRFYDMLPFLVHRNRFVCHIIFIDHSRNLYNHG